MSKFSKVGGIANINGWWEIFQFIKVFPMKIPPFTVSFSWEHTSKKKMEKQKKVNTSVYLAFAFLAVQEWKMCGIITGIPQEEL